MRTLVISISTLAAGFGLGRWTTPRVASPDAESGSGRASSAAFAPCSTCEADYVSAAEIAEYVEVARANAITDQQVRSVDVGNANVQVALAHRGRLESPSPGSVAEHSLVTEVYVVLSGSATTRTGPDMIDAVPRPDDYRSVVYLNGPGHNAADIRDAATHELGPGDVFVIPGGTGHQFARIDDHITYLMVRVDPAKVVPLMDAAASRAYLDENRVR